MNKRTWAMKAVLATALVVGMGIGAGAYAAFLDTFNDGVLDGWTTTPTGGVTAEDIGGGNYVAQLNDTQAIPPNPEEGDPGQTGSSSLFTAIELGSPSAEGNFYYQFDFNTSGLSDSGQVLDIFAASLYFTDTPVGSWPEFLALLDSDYAVIKWTVGDGYPAGATLTDLGDGWSQYGLTFADPGYTYAIPVFDLRDLNGVGGDSTVQVDNVSLVPEPLSMVMLGCLGAGMVVGRKLRRRNG